MTPKTAPKWRRVVVGALPVALGAMAFGVCLFGECQVLRASHALGSVLGEVTALLRDAETQWMAFACAGVYFIAFPVLRTRMAGIGGAGMRWNPSLLDDYWLWGLLAVAALAYALNYAEAVKSTQALTLLAGAMIGQGAAFFESRKQKAESRNGGGGILVVLVVLLAAAAAWQAETRLTFQYRGQTRWSGPWDNPNTFGMLMGVGVILSLGGLGSRKAEKLKTEILKEGEAKWWVWVRRVFFVGAALIMAVGLVKSYSRGAWVGTVIGMAYLFWSKQGRRMKDEGSTGKAEKLKAEMLKAAHQRVTLVIICASIGVLALWGFRDTEWRVARRAFSVGNVNDFSWRNRASAYEGSLQMMAAKPWLGYGWNQGEKVYEHFYRKPQVAEGAAFQLNDYFTLGTTLGVPALLCFLLYVGLALTRRPSSVLRPPPAPTDYRSLITDYCSKTTCQAGALVLLVGFWFDGGLFKLATGATFWILLELGKGDLATDCADFLYG